MNDRVTFSCRPGTVYLCCPLCFNALWIVRYCTDCTRYSSSPAEAKSIFIFCFSSISYDADLVRTVAKVHVAMHFFPNAYTYLKASHGRFLEKMAMPRDEGVNLE